MSTPQGQRTPAPPWVLMAIRVGGAVSLIRTLIPARRTDPWVWILLAFQVVVLVIAIAYLLRFLRAQRDDYWRERGKDLET